MLIIMTSLSVAISENPVRNLYIDDFVAVGTLGRPLVSPSIEPITPGLGVANICSMYLRLMQHASAGATASRLQRACQLLLGSG